VEKSEYRQGRAGWWLLQRGWKRVKQRKPKNGSRPQPLWSLDDGEPVTLSEAIKAEWERINKEFERKRECLLDQKIQCDP
jgi:hypothetical protein